MRRCWIFVLAALLLTGCSQSQDTFEYVTDVQEAPIPVMREVYVDLPEEAAAPVSETENCAIYECQDYEICVQTLSSGNLDSSIRTLTGYDRDRLTMMQTKKDGLSCYQFVWACAGDQVGRGLILDDGNYHYCVTVFGDAVLDSTEEWEGILSSVRLS